MRCARDSECWVTVVAQATWLPLLDSANPKLWQIALIVIDAAKIAPIVRKVQAHWETQPTDGIDWLELLETVLIWGERVLDAKSLDEVWGH